MPARHPTARRLITEGLRLFAERGIAGTSITSIEAAAGLAAGSGAFYKHFRSKEELYVAAVADAAANVASTTSAGDLLTAVDLRAQAELIARAGLAGLERHRDLLLVTIREGGRLPSGAQVEAVWPATGHTWFASWLRTKDEDGSLDVPDPDATAVVLLGALTAHWLNHRAATSRILAVDSDRLIDAWVHAVLAHRPPS